MVQFTPTSVVLFGLTFHWYGVIIAVGMALAVALARARERRLGQYGAEKKSFPSSYASS